MSSRLNELAELMMTGRDVGDFGWTGLDALPDQGSIDVVMNTNQNLYLMNFDLLGWISGSLLLSSWRWCVGSCDRAD